MGEEWLDEYLEEIENYTEYSYPMCGVVQSTEDTQKSHKNSKDERQIRFKTQMVKGTEK